jgi:hypothetical protein
MKRIPRLLAVIVTAALAVLVHRASSAQDKQDKYTLKVPGGLGFSEFKGYEDWQAVGPSQTDAAHVIRVILANPVMIDAYREGVPGNGKPFPDGSKIAKIEWRPKQVTDAPFSASTPDTVPGDLVEAEFIEKDSKRFADTHGWGYAMFDYDAASGTFRAGHLGQQAAAGARRQVRRRMPHAGRSKGLHFHGLLQKVSPKDRTPLWREPSRFHPDRLFAGA